MTIIVKEYNLFMLMRRMKIDCLETCHIFEQQEILYEEKENLCDIF